ncbi:hypothetical protein CISG_09407 [Coccidioides immitis RMSCC 3703]|uniref:Uncharacterized protein n=1 Tax=Coccidioides immitis RMSCC 3703 TaxID=454286 RepID=A0A0J8RBZ1_COCIT|nr:hypothetical protein CISG_09407 [Coccidioides immitis RMSCC 3703]
MAPSSRLSGSPAGTTKRSFGERARESATFFHAGVSSPPSGPAPGRRLDHAGRQCCRLLTPGEDEEEFNTNNYYFDSSSVKTSCIARDVPKIWSSRGRIRLGPILWPPEACTKSVLKRLTALSGEGTFFLPTGLGSA